jgi:hypothetical protein
MENEKNICQNPQLLEKKEEKMTEASPNQTAITETSQNKNQLDNKNLLTTTGGFVLMLTLS